MFLASNTAYQVITVFVPLAVFALFFASALGAYVWRPSRLRKILKIGIAAFVLVYLARSAYFVWLQYFTWKNDDFGKLFLPPNQPITYFLQYVWTHFLMDLPWVFGGAIILTAIVWVLGIVSKGRMVDQTDALLASFGALISGWPNMLSFFLVTLAAALLGGIVYGIINKQKSVVIPVTLFFFAGIIITFIWGTKITEFLELNQLIV